VGFYPSLILLLALQAPQPDALYRAGLISLQAQHYQEAEAAFRELYRLEPANTRGLLGIAHVYVAQSRNAEALDLVHTESEKHPERADLHLATGDVAVLAGQQDAALTEFQNALGLLDVVSRETAGVYLRIGEVYRNKGDLKASIAALQRASELAPDDGTILTSLAMSLDTSGDKKNALADYRAALAMKPDNPVAQNNLAYLIAEMGGDLYEALRLARDAKRSAPQMLEISDTIGWVSLKLGWVDDAIDTFSDLVRVQPGNESFRSHLSAALDQKHDRPKNLNDLRAALRANPTAENQQTSREMLKKPDKR
jgi:tetratricopeptide (TPR) repeat protein